MPAPATTLQDAALRLQLTPLVENSTDYVDLSDARGSNSLASLTERLSECAAAGITRCHLAFVGHRGSGKSSELTRIAGSLRHSYFPVILTLDPTLENDADYPELLLWMVEGVAAALKTAGVPFDLKLLEPVEKWFAAVTKESSDVSGFKMSIAAEASATAGFSFFGLGAKILGKIKSAIQGSREYRHTVRERIKESRAELLTILNTFLQHARTALTGAGRPARLLIIQDNLDRLDRESALRIFSGGGETLQGLDGHFLWTPPVGSHLAPFKIATVMDTYFMPMISIRRRTGTVNKTAVAGLSTVISTRMAAHLFATPSVLRELVLLSGGSVRELLRLTDRARLNARTEKRDHITKPDVIHAAKLSASAIQNAFIPNNVYFPILAEIHLHKELISDLDGGFTAERVDARREFFHRLLSEEAIYAYNGDDYWLDIHPALLHLRSFKETLDKLRNAMS